MLHIVNKSPFEKNSLDTCLRLSLDGSKILLIEDGVYAALKGSNVAMNIATQMQRKSFYVLGADLKARGIKPDKLLDGFEIVDYKGFVELAASVSKTQSWL